MAEYWKGKEMVLAMSGSPAPHNPTDWWHPAEVVRPGFLREKNLTKCRTRLAIYAKDTEYPTIIGWNEDEVSKLYQRLKGLTVVLKKEDCLDLPDKIYETLSITPTQDVLNAAKFICDSGEPAIAVLSKLRQLSDGFQYLNNSEIESDHAVIGYDMDAPKDKLVRQCLDRCDDSGRIVLYAGFIASVNHLVELCQAEGWEVIRVDSRGWKGFVEHVSDDPSQETFQRPYDGQAKIAFVGNPGSAGMGLTLTRSNKID